MGHSEEERKAWDGYMGIAERFFSALVFGGSFRATQPITEAAVADQLATFADAMLDERRKRFGSGAEQQ